MNKAVIYFGATGNEAADQMVMQVLEEYCTVNGYEVVAVISENARPEGMTFPMKFAFVGMAEVEERLRQQMKQQIIEARHQMEIFAGTLDGLSPAKKLMQGYSVAVNDAGRNIRSTKDVQPGEDIVIRVTDGAVLAKVTGIKEQIRWEKN